MLKWMTAAAFVFALPAAADECGSPCVVLSVRADRQIGGGGPGELWRVPAADHTWNADASPFNDGVLSDWTVHHSTRSHTYSSLKSNTGPVCLWTTPHADGPDDEPGASGRTMQPGDVVRITGGHWATGRPWFVWAAAGTCAEIGIDECSGICGR